MCYLSARSFWGFVLLIVVLYLNSSLQQPPEPEPGGMRPQDIAPPGVVITMAAVGAAGEEAEAQKHRFTIPATTQKLLYRTTPVRVSFSESCDYLAYYCLKAYNTGQLCGRTLYYGYHTFRNYCLMDYVNCRERYEVWQIMHMGPCVRINYLKDYIFYPYEDDYFLDHYYAVEDNR